MNSIDAVDDMATIWQFPFFTKSFQSDGENFSVAGGCQLWMGESEVNFCRVISITKNFSLQKLLPLNDDLLRQSRKKIICNHLKKIFSVSFQIPFYLTVSSFRTKEDFLKEKFNHEAIQVRKFRKEKKGVQWSQLRRASLRVAKNISPTWVELIFDSSNKHRDEEHKEKYEKKSL